MRSPGELDAALTVAKAKSDGVMLSDEQVISTGDSPRRIADFALRNQLSRIGPPDYAHVGGLIGYGVDWTEVMRRSMTFGCADICLRRVVKHRRAGRAKLGLDDGAQYRVRGESPGRSVPRRHVPVARGRRGEAGG